MRPLLITAALACALPAHAQTVSVAGAGGFSGPSRQPWTGLDIALHHDDDHGVRPLFRLRGGYAFANPGAVGDFQQASPLGRLEAGVAFVVPGERAMTRVGVLGLAEGFLAPYGAGPTQIGGVPDDGDAHVVILPGGMLQVEMGFARPDADKGVKAWSIGVRLGAGLGLGFIPCDDDPRDACLGVGAGFVGGITARVWFHERIFLEAMAGPDAYLGVGVAFGRHRWRGVVGVPANAPRMRQLLEQGEAPAEPEPLQGMPEPEPGLPDPNDLVRLGGGDDEPDDAPE